MNNEQLIKTISDMYPYGQFPSQYIKSNQNKDNVNLYTQEKFEQNNVNIQSLNESNTNNTQNNNEKSNITIQALLPLMNKLKNKEKMNSTDLITNLMPIIAGNRGKDIGAMLKLLTPNDSDVVHTNNQETLHSSKYKSIDSYERV